MKRLVICWLAAPLLALAAAEPPANADAALAGVFNAVAAGEMASALQQTDALIRRYPNYRLAHLIRGDLLQARAGRLTDFGAGAAKIKTASAELAGLREEAVARLAAWREKPPADQVPRYLLQLRAEQKYALVVDTQKSRLYVYRNDHGVPRLAADYYISYGKLGIGKKSEGDQRTPIGVYHVVSSRPREKLPDFYGSGAYPLNYPNAWDRRMGRSGHGIWLHGTSSATFARPPRASDGCVVLTNADLSALAQDLQIGVTPVIISNGVEWVSLDAWQAERRALMNEIDAWRRDRASGDSQRQARHYARGFAGSAAAPASVQRVALEREKLDAADIDILRAPGQDAYVVVGFDAGLGANAYRARQYWIKEDGAWKIAHEEQHARNQLSGIRHQERTDYANDSAAAPKL